MSNIAVLSKAPIVARFAERFGMDPNGVMDVLKSTAFKTKVDGQPATDNQMMALMIVADQYKLNPFTKEIYAYPDKQNGIVPVVGVDGWSRIINEHPQLDGIEFNYSEKTVNHKGKTCHEWIECVIYRKDRQRPTIIRERFEEVVRGANFTTPWDTHPNRMHRHKSLIQCARVAFGFAGIYDDDEAARILEATGGSTVIDAETGEVAGGQKPPAKPPLPEYPESRFAKNLPGWKKNVEEGNPVADLLAMLQSKYTLSQDQLDKINALGKPATPAPAALAAEMTEEQKAFAAEIE